MGLRAKCVSSGCEAVVQGPRKGCTKILPVCVGTRQNTSPALCFLIRLCTKFENHSL
jgi:hypothetical protein